MTDSDDVTLRLTSDEALVLYDLLHRWNSDQVSVPKFQGEQIALWNLSALLEQALVAPLDSKYDELVIAARDRLTAAD